MDEIVKQALKKWPNVPHCYDWLALDARGDWYMRDERIQRAGPFPGQGQPHPAREAARVHRAQLPARRGRLLVLPERAAARLRRARGGAVDLAAHAGRRRGAGGHQPHRAGRVARYDLARRAGPAVPVDRARPGHRAHAGHGTRGRRRRGRRVDAAADRLRGDAGTFRLRAQARAGALSAQRRRPASAGLLARAARRAAYLTLFTM